MCSSDLSQDMGRVVEWREVAAYAYFLHYILIDEHRMPEEVGTLHNAVSHSVYFVEIADYSHLRVGEYAKHKLHSKGVVRDRLHPYYRLFSCRLVSEFTVREGYFFENTFCEKGVIFVAAHIKQLILDRRTSTIDDKNFHNGRKFSKKSLTLAPNLD